MHYPKYKTNALTFIHFLQYVHLSFPPVFIIPCIFLYLPNWLSVSLLNWAYIFIAYLDICFCSIAVCIFLCQIVYVSLSQTEHTYICIVNLDIWFCLYCSLYNSLSVFLYVLPTEHTHASSILIHVFVYIAVYVYIHLMSKCLYVSPPN